MIYNSTIESLRDQELSLEGVEDRFKYESMLEAEAVVLAESERNWTSLMKACGLMESKCIQEGINPQMIYEGNVLKSFFDKAIGFFKLLINKIKEITTAFINKVAGLVTTNARFIKMYGSKLTGSTSQFEDFEYEGYTYKNLPDKPDFGSSEFLNADREASIVSSKADLQKAKEEFSRDRVADLLARKNKVNGGATAENFAEKLDEHFRGSEDKETLKNIDLGSQKKIIENTKDLKKKAGDSYKSAVTEINKIIKKLEDLKNKADKEKDGAGKQTSENASIMIQYWKDYGNCCLTLHVHHINALKARNSQARAICVKALNAMNKKKSGENKKDIKNRYNMEGYVETDAFLGAVEFI